jgi:uncharacterized membrane protein YqiK
MSVLGWIILLIVIVAVLVVIAGWLYERARNEVAIVKTGVGGRKVIIDGGTIAIPYFHEITRVNMQTIRMDVSRTGESSLITKDRMRVDVGAEFYASVEPKSESIIRAAQTLGSRLFQPDQLKSLIDGMMIDALRAVAAQMTMDELHENRSEFVREVREALADTLKRYGLQLDSVSLTALDQTPFSSLDENNAFNAVGMRKLAEVIAKSKKERAEIESQSQVSVRKAAMLAEKQKLEIDLEQRTAEIHQRQEIETLMASQLAEVAQRKAQSEWEAARAKLLMEENIQAADIERERKVRQAQIDQERELELAEQARRIALDEKSREESQAKAEADQARAAAIEAAEMLITVRMKAEAERRKELAIIQAKERAESETVKLTATAQAERKASEDIAAAERTRSEAERDRLLALATAKEADVKANNAKSSEIIHAELEEMRLAALPKIISEMVKPAEKIKGININQISGFGSSGSSNGGSTPVNQAMESILDMAVQLPALKKIGEQIGVNLETSLDQITNDKK